MVPHGHHSNRVKIAQKGAENQNDRQCNVQERQSRHFEYAHVVKHVQKHCTFGPNQPKQAQKNALNNEKNQNRLLKQIFERNQHRLPHEAQIDEPTCRMTTPKALPNPVESIDRPHCEENSMRAVKKL
jgi:hypothetical protein